MRYVKKFIYLIMLMGPGIWDIVGFRKQVNMTQKVYGMTDVIREVKRLADAMEEILRLVKKDMEPKK
jgi:hypothetical protein